MTAFEPAATAAFTPNGQPARHELPRGDRFVPSRSRNPITWLPDLFSSVWLGVFLLTCLFVYSSIGSAGVPIHPNIFDPASWVAVRQLRPFELTEFEWFHWWPFDLLIALICTNLVVATLRRIPFNIVNLGVWMIHSGIIILCLGSVWYFSTKVEGDALVNRRLIRIEAPGVEPTTMIAMPGARAVVGSGSSAYFLEIANIDPQWELRSGDDAGKKVYSVSVLVQSATGQFMRQLLADFPQYTEDVIRSPGNDPAQPMQRAVKVLGKPLVDEALKLSLEFAPQDTFYLVDSRAVYLREIDDSGRPKSPWIQRPIKSRALPRYNDYIASWDDVFADSDHPPLPLESLSVEVPPRDPNDPLPNVNLSISRYLRYAQIESRRRVSPNGPINPTITVRLSTSPGQSKEYQLAAFDPAESSALENNMKFVWAHSAGDIDEWRVRRDPAIRFTVPGTDIQVEKSFTAVSAQNPDLPFEPIEGTDYSFRIQGTSDKRLFGDKLLSVAVVEIRTPQRMFTRWVFDDPQFNRDLAMAEGVAQHDAEIPLDAKLETVYVPGQYPPAPILLVAGPGEDDLSLIVTMADGQPSVTPIAPSETTPLAAGVSLEVLRYAARTETLSRPYLVPRERRDRDIREMMSMIQVDIPNGDIMESAWLPYHHFAFNGPEEVLRRFPYRPVVIPLADGRRIEMLFSRESRSLPAPVALDDFQVASHVGGFTGQTSSIMDWISMITFDGSDGWTNPIPVSMNKPKEFDGYWFFQAQWDPPDPPRFQGDIGSRGLNYTVLGVGNRNGVNVQLAGCCIAVLGMIYAFYWKPVIKRRRAQAAYARAAAAQLSPRAESLRLEPVGLKS
jgi:hypothetical protein